MVFRYFFHLFGKGSNVVGVITDFSKFYHFNLLPLNCKPVVSGFLFDAAGILTPPPSVFPRFHGPNTKYLFGNMQIRPYGQRFAVETLMWSPEFVIHINLEHGTMSMFLKIGCFPTPPPPSLQN